MFHEIRDHIINNVGYQLATSSGSYNEEAGLETLSKYADLYGLKIGRAHV